MPQNKKLSVPDWDDVHAQAGLPRAQFDPNPWRPAFPEHVRTVGNWMIKFVREVRANNEDTRAWIDVDPERRDWSHNTTEQELDMQPLPERCVVSQYEHEPPPNGNLGHFRFDRREVAFHWHDYWDAI